VGYTFGRCQRVISGEAYLGTRPSKKRVARLCQQISQMTRRHTCGRPTEEMVGELNLVLKGWANYFQLGSVSKAYRAVDSHARNRLRRWLCCKRKLEGKGTRRYSDQYLEGTLGLIRLARFRATMPWVKAT
jgi:RNA-directed DNA polymerase